MNLPRGVWSGFPIGRGYFVFPYRVGQLVTEAGHDGQVTRGPLVQVQTPNLERDINKYRRGGAVVDWSTWDLRVVISMLHRIHNKLYSKFPFEKYIKYIYIEFLTTLKTLDKDKH